jgi:drug/metabolite transporter (DMT)-like permease
MARFTSRGIGAPSALLGMLLVGSLAFSLWAVLGAPPLVWRWDGAWLIALNGAATTVMTLLLYVGLARGPVSVVAPIVAAHPALVVAFAVVFGSRPTAVQWAAMAATIGGAAIVALAVRTGESVSGEPARPGGLPVTIMIAVASAFAYAALILAGQAAVPIYGEFQTAWLGRGASLAAVGLVMVARRIRPRLERRWWPVLGVQGLLDAAGYLFLFAGSHGDNPEIAAVAGSAFGAVTTLLAWIVLRERIGPLQWCGIAVVFVGVAVLSLSQESEVPSMP